MERAPQVHIRAFPVVVLLCLATAQGQLDSPQKTEVPNSVEAIRLPSSPNVSYSRNQTFPSIISAKIRENSNKNVRARCKNCGVKPPPAKGSLEYKMRIEMIKQQILNKLHMDEEPKISRPTNFGLPRPLVKKFQERLFKEEKKEPPPKSKTEVILIGNKVSLAKLLQKPTKTRKVKFMFHVSNKVYQNGVRSADLWVYRSRAKELKRTILTVKDSDASNGDSPSVITKTIEAKDHGWISFDVKHIVELWKSRVFKKKTPNFTNSCALEISCLNCDKEGEEFVGSRSLQRPFMVVDLLAEGKSRKKRAIDCRPGLKDCCRQEFYVSFKEMAWDNWIMIPKGFNANYCTGSCYGHILPMYHHTGILQKLALQKKQRQIAPCCSPTKLAGLSLIYFDKDENIFHEEIEHMVVEECGCS